MADGTAEPDIDTSVTGIAITADAEAAISLTGIPSDAARDLWIYVKDMAGNIGKLRIDIPAFVNTETDTETPIASDTNDSGNSEPSYSESAGSHTHTVTIEIAGIYTPATLDAEGILRVNPTEVQWAAILEAAVMADDVAQITWPQNITVNQCIVYIPASWFYGTEQRLTLRMGDIGSIEAFSFMISPAANDAVGISLARGSVAFSLFLNGRQIEWSSADDSVILGIPFSSAGNSEMVIYNVDTGVSVTGCVYSDGWLFGDVFSTGRYDARVVDKPTDTFYRVVANRLNVRSSAGTSHTVVEKLIMNTVVTVLETSNGWGRVQLPGGGIGWISLHYVVPVSIATAAGDYYTTANLHVRAETSSQAKSLAILRKGAKVTLTGKVNNGYVEMLYDGGSAFIHGAYLSQH